MKNTDRTVTDGDKTVKVSLPDHDYLAERFWVNDDRAYDDFVAPGERLDGDFYAGLASLGFIKAALRRSARRWCGIAAAGLLAGLGAFVLRPAGYQASTSLLLTQPPGAQVGWIADDQAIAQSRTVAGIAVRSHDLRLSPASLASAYTVTAITDRVLLITVKAASSEGALREATALATEFLRYRAHLLQTQQQLVTASLRQQVTEAQQQISSINSQISTLSTHPATPKVRRELASLHRQRALATEALIGLKQATVASGANMKTATTAAVSQSAVLDPAGLINQSGKKRLAVYLGSGLLGGLALGLAIVVVGALMSDQLRRRDDIVRVFGAPVRLSVGRVELSRWRLRRPKLAAASSTNVRRIVAHLSNEVAPGSGVPASLAVVPVDDVQAAAVCLAAMAVSFARRGMQVVVADLCTGAPAARLLGVADPGVRDVGVEKAHLTVTDPGRNAVVPGVADPGVPEVSAENARLTVAIPEGDAVAPEGPLQRGECQAPEPLAAACASADLLLTLVPLDPAVGSEYLAGWADSVVAMVTAGRSTATRIRSVGEMIRLAGTPLVSAVLVGADKRDESLGLTPRTGRGGQDESVTSAVVPRWSVDRR